VFFSITLFFKVLCKHNYSQNQITMTQTNLSTQPVSRALLVRRMLVGAAIALIVILTFVLRAGTPNPEWGKLWMIRPLVVTPLAGGVGGLVYHLMDHVRSRGGWQKVLANVLSVIIYVFGLWMGIVLGLEGTLWN
jgi:hypothetical protein